MRNLIITIISTIVIFTGFSGVSLADHHYGGCGGMMMSDLTEMDTDNDGFISLDEFAEPHMEKYRGWFKMLDTNDDGSLSQEEWGAFRKAHGYGEKSEG